MAQRQYLSAIAAYKQGAKESDVLDNKIGIAFTRCSICSMPAIRMSVPSS